MIKLITFDLDNTLWHADPVLIRAEQTLYQWLQTHCPNLTDRYSNDEMHRFKTEVARRNPALKHKVSALRLEALKLSLLEVGYPADQAEQMAEQAFAVFHHARQQVTFFDHTLNVLNELKKRYRLAALTNGNADIQIIGLDNYFEFALSADSVGKQKPSPEMFLQALQRADVAADEAIHIGDHPEQDIVGAQNQGFHTIWVNFEAAPWDYAMPPTAIANCLSEIPKLIAQIADESIN